MQGILVQKGFEELKARAKGDTGFASYCNKIGFPSNSL
jgi:hypothetical protein